jgi:hypothetical protein
MKYQLAVFGAVLLFLTLGWGWWRTWKEWQADADRAWRKWCLRNGRVPPSRRIGAISNAFIDRVYRVIGKRL